MSTLKTILAGIVVVAMLFCFYTKGEIPKSLAPDADGPGGVNREMMQWVIDIIKGSPSENEIEDKGEETP